ncbi:MAG: hypothetical protein LBU27_03720 [Candidatus Peribacteria bacterium]|jgi:Ca2+/Na+ antiporter|nr:hypothetical protein [Candidatus Peribacteria bacterium]
MKKLYWKVAIIIVAAIVGLVLAWSVIKPLLGLALVAGVVYYLYKIFTSKSPKDENSEE